MEELITKYPFFVAIIISLISSIANLLIKIGSKRKRKYINKFYLIAYLKVLILLMVMPYILKFSKFNIIIMILSLNYLFIFFLSKYYFKENYSKKNYIGILLIFIGVISINL